MKDLFCGKIASSIIMVLVFFLTCSTFAVHADTHSAEINNPDIGGGKILLYTTDGEYKGAANVGNLPDMVTFLPGGNGLVSANEGEPNDDYTTDPRGSISIITLNNEIKGLVQDVTTLTFEDAHVPADVRIKPGSTPAVDLEPEYIAVSEDGSIAWVSLQENNALAFVDLKAKKIRILKDMGKDANGIYTKLYLAGTRSFSIWDASGNQVYDSGKEFEQYLADNYADTFNTRVDDVKKQKDIDELNADNVQFEMVGEKAYFWEGVDARSQKKGCEPEALALAKIGAKTFAYIGLEKQGGFFIYDITNPKSPAMIDYYNDINYDALPTEAGDLAPEGMVTFAKENNHYLAVANELSGTVSVFELAKDGHVKKLDTLTIGTFDEGAAEILSYDTKGEQLFVTNGEQKTIDIISVASPCQIMKVGEIGFSEHADGLQSVSVNNGLVAIAVERK